MKTIFVLRSRAWLAALLLATAALSRAQGAGSIDGEADVLRLATFNVRYCNPANGDTGDIWAAAYTPDLAVTIWMGRDSNENGGMPGSVYADGEEQQQLQHDQEHDHAKPAEKQFLQQSFFPFV